MRNTGKGAWLVGGAVATLLAVLVGWLAVANLAQADVSELKIGSGTAAPGENVTVKLTAQATTPGIGGYGVNIVFDTTKLSVVSCSSTHGVCHFGGEPGVDLPVGTVRINGSVATDPGLTGAQDLGQITFKCTAAGTANLDASIGTGDLTNPAGTDISVTPTDGTITCAVAPTATATTVATAAPTATATTTVSAPPSTGGGPADASSTAGWLVLAIGLGLAVAGSGAWTVSRMRQKSR